MNCRSFSPLRSAQLVPKSGRRSLHGSSSRRAILMPYMSPFMTSGSIKRWHKKEGDLFQAGDILLQIESEFTTVNVEAQNPGIIGKILVPDGSTNVLVEQVIALVAKTPQELARLQEQHKARAPMPPPPVPPVQQHHFHPQGRGPFGLEHAKSPMMSSARRSPSLFEMHTGDANAIHATGVRGMVTDHANSQHHSELLPRVRSSPPAGLHSVRESLAETAIADDQLNGAALRKTIVSTLSRRGSGAKSSVAKKCTTAQYFEGIL
ncbi:single hybrid motif-containing protein [Mycena rebaudengoi]|nr:single hybrid motif-containing protein [Mycena rebaudengoi]